ncbi:hypothetical protein DXG01_016982 [Tephrocybe rancida]|nr:hypothetical protein DXG01_016982 [Tephrocybe rancida]
MSFAHGQSHTEAAPANRTLTHDADGTLIDEHYEYLSESLRNAAAEGCDWARLSFGQDGQYVLKRKLSCGLSPSAWPAPDQWDGEYAVLKVLTGHSTMLAVKH